MAASKGLLLLLAACCLAAASAQDALFQRPSNFSQDCLPPSTTVSTFAAVFPSDFFLSGGQVQSTQDQSTTVTVAKNFAVEYFPAYKKVTNTLTNETYILYQCGSRRPSGSVTRGSKVFQIPLTSLAVTDTVPYAFLDILNVTDRVQSVSSFAVSACAQRALECNRTAVSSSDLSNQTVLTSRVLPYVDGVTVTTALDPAPPQDVPYFTFSAAQDPGPLNRAEWVKFLGLFFNKEKAASDYFAMIEKEYNATKAKAASANSKPTVAWVTHYVYQPDEYYQIAFTPYKLQFTQDAGAQMISRRKVAAIKGVTVDAFDNSTYDFAWKGKGAGFGSKAQARAAFLDAISGVDVLIDETYTVDPSSYTYSNFTNEYGISAAAAKGLAFLNGTNPSVYREDGLISATGGLDWFEGAIAHPEGVLSDLASAFTTTDPKARKFTWFRNIQQEPTVITAANCSTQKSCAVTPTPICPLVKACPDGTVVNLLNTEGCKYEACGASSSPSNTTAASESGAPSPSPQAASATAALSVLSAAAAAVALLAAL